MPLVPYLLFLPPARVQRRDWASRSASMARLTSCRMAWIRSRELCPKRKRSFAKPRQIAW
jgi:hypothetical protein